MIARGMNRSEYAFSVQKFLVLFVVVLSRLFVAQTVPFFLEVTLAAVTLLVLAKNFNLNFVKRVKITTFAVNREDFLHSL